MAGKATPGFGHNVDHFTKKAPQTRAAVKATKNRILELLTQGYSIKDTMSLIGKSVQAYDYYRKSDAWFRSETSIIMERRRRGDPKTWDLGFEEFSERYLKHKLFNHQLQWIDLVEGRRPRNLHPAQKYIAGDRDRIIINTPPGHAKSTTITMNYVTYKIVTDPTFRVVIVSKTETMAKKFLQGIKRRLTNPYYRELIRDFAPAEGFEEGSEQWSQRMIYFSHQEGGEKDPTVEVLGIGQQIYGARADLIILDDVEDLRNVNEVEKHFDWVTQEVHTRDARILVVGTRVAAVDLYTMLPDPRNYAGEDLYEEEDEEEDNLWTYLSQPALLDASDDGYTTLWPKSNQPHARNPGERDADGLWPKWDWARLKKLRRGMSPRMWSLVYQQQDVHDDAIFPQAAVLGSKNMLRGSGPWTEFEAPGNYESFYNIAGLDPASAAGYTAIVVLSVDKRTGKRYLMDVRNAHMTPERMRREIRDVTERFDINEWRVERNSFQAFLTQDREINQYMAARGVRFTEHQTQGNKWDPAWGVASMAQLFRGWEDGWQLIELPGRQPKESVKTLIEQLVTWNPDIPKTQRTDTVMALWFAEIRAREVCQVEDRTDWYQNDFLSDNDYEARVVIDIDDYLRDERMMN